MVCYSVFTSKMGKSGAVRIGHKLLYPTVVFDVSRSSDELEITLRNGASNESCNGPVIAQSSVVSSLLGTIVSKHTHLTIMSERRCDFKALREFSASILNTKSAESCERVQREKG